MCAIVWNCEVKVQVFKLITGHKVLYDFLFMEDTRFLFIDSLLLTTVCIFMASVYFVRNFFRMLLVFKKTR
jgi:hypothetical protein